MLTFIKVLRSEGVSKDGHATTEDFRGSPIEYTILQSVKQKKSIIGVVDLGETGLPLANKLVSNGFKVIGFDLDEKRVKKINKGKSYVSTVSDKALSDAVKRRKFRAFKDFRFLSKADIIVICIPLALKERKTFFQITRKVSKYLRKNQLVCIETIVPPKTTNKCMKTLIPSDLQADKDFFLAYTPLCLFNNEKTKIIGGVGETSTKFAKEFYDLNNYLTSTVSSTTTAEVINIYNHIYLTVQRGLRNEFEMIGDRFRIKPLELSFMNEVKEDYTLIESDLHYLINKLSKNSPRRYNLYQMVTLATNMNNNRLFHIRRKVINLLKKDKIQFREANILVLGVTNNNQKDRTALNLIQLLIKDKINVQYYDKQLPKLRYKNNFLLSSINIAKENFQTYDLVVVMSIDHEIDYKRMAKLSRRILLANNGLGVLKNNQLSKK
jgi:UDP-N-acetyl-D-glucosamine dehydrogenase